MSPFLDSVLGISVRRAEREQRQRAADNAVWAARLRAANPDDRARMAARDAMIVKMEANKAKHHRELQMTTWSALYSAGRLLPPAATEADSRRPKPKPDDKHRERVPSPSR